jgi:hypothetical protein
MPSFKAQFTQQEVRRREDLIIKYIVSLINDAQQMAGIIPYFFYYGIIDWSWPLRFAKSNQEYKGFKYYSDNAYNAICNGERQFTRDHYFPKKRLKTMLLNIESPDENSVREIMEKYGDVCVITRQEDAALRAAGLYNDMPPGWQIGDDIFARYRIVGINTWTNDRQW